MWGSFQLLASRRETDFTFMKYFCGKTFLVPKEAEQQVLSANILIGKQVRFLCGKN
jgi:hypothetical protein